ncbi:MAG: LAGLIDADG family homing endonuclease [Nanoarchaeota archaeon]|nr:LAGLIDADG family homing endonuclease [Nanoarchaeota archaeon]
MTGSKKIKVSFLRGYFDGDGTTSNRIRMFSTNIEGLKQVSKILVDLKFKHTFQGPIIKERRKPSYIIQISEKESE